MNAGEHLAQMTDYLRDIELTTEMPNGPDPGSFAASVDDHCAAHPQERLKTAIAAAFAKFERESPVL
ncbi:MAG TPA: hypothetical protein VMV45_21305 [Casimicrobiaceae bacterium]|nr:hypothetical protein [Casimicrobiaceae bacterium]